MSTTSPPAPERIALIIGSEGGLLETIERAVSNFDFTVRRAYTGSEGIAEALKHYPDLVLCDDRLKDTERDLVIGQLRQVSILGDVPILGFGKAPSIPDLGRHSNTTNTADVYIPKPFSLQDVQNHLRLLISRGQQRHTPSKLWIQGDLEGFNLPDILSITEQSRLTGLLVAQTSAGVFRFLFDQGSLMRVAGPHNVRGMKALFRALRPEEGSFAFHPWREVHENPFHEHIRIGNALLGAMQEKDELPLAWRDLPDPDQHLTIGPNISKAELEKYETLATLSQGKALGMTVQQLLDHSEQIDLDAIKEVQDLIKQNILIPFP